MLLSCLLLAALASMVGCASHTADIPPGATPAVRATPDTKQAAAIVRTASVLKGAPYKWGGYSPETGFDCSGLIWFVYHQHGINLPRMSWQQFGVGTAIHKSEIRPGDLVFYKVNKSGKTLHVGIVTDRGTFIHAPSSGKQVMESNLNLQYWKRHYIGARRVF
ncbi:C40 family peptidase [Pseudodesulfovibrio sediminis]|nr:C40 family peptidase [Pseudodesulfovibrio sediminis]